VKDLVRSKLVPQLRVALSKVGPALIAEHGKDIQHAPGVDPTAAFPKPVTLVKSSSAAQSNAKSTTTTTHGASGKKSNINTTTLTDNVEFNTTAEQLYQTFTDPQRLAAFTRAPPKVWEGAKVGAKFELFGGNVAGEFVVLDEPKTIEQLWRLGSWPEGHYSHLEIKFDQNDRDAVTIMRLKWDGVPVGQEEVTKRNWSEYYVVSC
jgi:activator of HSP90 ATPase